MRGKIGAVMKTSPTEILDEDGLRTLLQAAPVAIVAVDSTGTILLVNDKLCDLFQYRIDELLHQPIEMLLPQALRALHVAHRKHYEAAPHVRAMGSEMDLTGQRKDGSIFSLEAGLSPIQLADKRIILATVIDITDRKATEEALERATIAERNRIAHDLHDSVTQTLFAASMIADVLPELWQMYPDEGEKRLQELRDLTRGALAEMRTLLLELRPATLEDVTLPELLKQLINGVAVRGEFSVDFQVNGDCNLPVDVRMAFFRTAQEAMNNIAKHAEATNVDIQLDCGPTLAMVKITDNGRGFKVDEIPPNHIGLDIMHERAASVHANLIIESTLSQGTTVQLTWHKR